MITEKTVIIEIAAHIEYPGDILQKHGIMDRISADSLELKNTDSEEFNQTVWWYRVPVSKLPSLQEELEESGFDVTEIEEAEE
jgi:hypothetical protein